MDDYITIGKVVAPFGVRGEVKVVILTEFPERLSKGKTVTLRYPDGKFVETAINASRPNKGGLLISFEGPKNRMEARELKDAEVVIDRADVKKLPKDEFYLFELVGLNVVTDDGRELGVVEDVLQGGANDVYVTSEEICIPAIKQVVKSIDVKAGKIVIHPMPGLLPGE
jgi:16S rRNA processing protein RimM